MATNEFEYPLGVIHGDGHISHERKGITITVSLKDENYKDLLKRMFVEAFGCELHEYRQVGGYHLSTWKLEATKHFLCLKHVGHWIIPKLEHPEEYLAGLFDTDGHVGLRFWRGTTIMRIKLCQKPNGNLVMPMLQALGLNPLMRRYKCGRHSQDIISIRTCEFELFAEKVPLEHPRKVAMLKKILEYRRKHRCARVTPSMAAEAVRLHQAGMRCSEVARTMGLGWKTVGYWLKKEVHFSEVAQRSLLERQAI